MILLKGAAAAAKIKEEIDGMLEGLDGHRPSLAIVRVGERPDDLAYERGALKRMEKLGLSAEVFAFPEDVDGSAFEDAFRKLNRDPQVDGILVLRPLPEQIDEGKIAELIDPQKDVDGISPVNAAKVFSGDKTGFAPCTAEAVMEILRAYEIPVSGRRAVVVGRSMVVGRPLAMLLLQENATVTVCHTRTADLPGTCREGEILAVAAGRAKMLDASFVGENAVVIDVGINVDEEGNLCGDVDLETLEGKAAMATPVPGGVGAVTTSVLAKHLVLAVARRRELTG